MPTALNSAPPSDERPPHNKMKISIITATYNSEATIADTIHSIDTQTYGDIEHIIIDGLSSDATLAIVNSSKAPWRQVFCEADQGLYDAMNKGIARASGDLIGILNSDDLYVDGDVLDKVACLFADPNTDACYADLVYVDKLDTSKIVRYWKSSPYQNGLFQTGWMPPHPTFFVRRSVYERFGTFDLNYKLAADVELLMRFIAKEQIRTVYLPEILVKMRIGGATNKSITNILKQNLEIRSAAIKNGFRLSPLFLVNKLLVKVPQFFSRPEGAL